MKRRLHILFVDDDAQHCEAVRRAHESLMSLSKISFIFDGQSALDFLHGKQSPEDLAHPVGLVMLDVDIPGMNGHEVLRQIRQSPKTTNLPVIMLTNSSSPKDIEQAYAERATSYVVKPRNLEKLRHLMLQVDGFWSQSASLPPTLDFNDD